MKILLMGNPNVGKSALFSRLTGVDVVCSNYPGTTVGYCTGSVFVEGDKAELIDVPGTYSLTATSPAESVAVDFIPDGDVIVNVVDATNLERNLLLTMQLLARGKPTIIALNMADETKHLGITIDSAALSERLGVPVVETVAVTGAGIKELVEKMPAARIVTHNQETDDERWKRIGRIVGEVQTIVHRHHTIWDRLEEATIQPITGLPIAAAVLFITFSVIVHAGNFIIENILDPFFEGVYGPLIRGLVRGAVPEGIARDILIGTSDDFIESFGLLTTGVYVPLDMVLPFVALFYLCLSMLEDSGYLPRLATLMDNLMHKIGLHGTAIVPQMLGLGCNVPGMLATRILETEKQRFISAVLMAMCIPCLAQNALIMGLLAPRGVEWIAVVYGVLLMVYIATGLMLNKAISGESPEILLEIPPYRRPNPMTLLKKTFVRVRYFITDAVPYVMLGVLIVNVLYFSGILDATASVFGPVMSVLFGLPQEAVFALIIGFLRKDVAVGMLAPLALSSAQLAIACTVLALYFPCVATFTVLLKELGLKETLKALAIMMVMTVLVGSSMKLALL